MPKKVNTAILKESMECFSIYSTNGQLASSDVGMALRSIGLNPSNADVKKVLEEVGNPPSVSYETFKVILT